MSIRQHDPSNDFTSGETTRFAVESRGLCVWYGQQCALQDVDLPIPHHQITAVVGPSGSGKSTFLTTFNRLTDLVANCRVEGRVLVGGQDVMTADCDVLQLRRRVGMVFQKPNPFPLSIRRNLAVPLREHGMPAVQVDAAIESTLRDVGLWDEVKDRLDASAERLSGGQQQRLCLARTLALKPEVILFDEPCSALDPVAAAVVEELIASLRDRVTVVIVTHNLPQARRIADQVAVFWLQDAAGRLVESGPADHVFRGDRDDRVGKYLRSG